MASLNECRSIYPRWTSWSILSRHSGCLPFNKKNPEISLKVKWNILFRKIRSEIVDYLLSSFQSLIRPKQLRENCYQSYQYSTAVPIGSFWQMLSTLDCHLIPSVTWLVCIDRKFIDCRPTVDRHMHVDRVSIKGQPRCRWSIDGGSIKGIDQGYQSRISINTRPRMPLVGAIQIIL